MLVKTIFNRVSRFKSFVVEKVRISGEELEIVLQPRRNGAPICSSCGVAGSSYDRRKERRYEFVPFWGTKTYFVYAPRRVNCVCCGVTVERVPWCEGKHRMTTMLRQFLAHWARKISVAGGSVHDMASGIPSSGVGRRVRTR